MNQFLIEIRRIVGLIYPTFYDQFLCVQNPKAQKDTDDFTVFFVLLESARVKAVYKHVGEINP